MRAPDQSLRDDPLTVAEMRDRVEELVRATSATAALADVHDALRFALFRLGDQPRPIRRSPTNPATGEGPLPDDQKLH